MVQRTTVDYRALAERLADPNSTVALRAEIARLERAPKTMGNQLLTAALSDALALLREASAALEWQRRLAVVLRGERDDEAAEVAALRAQLADIEALRALSEAATPGPWEVHVFQDPKPDSFARWISGHSAWIANVMVYERNQEDASLLVAAVNAIRAALSVPAVPVGGV